VAVAIKVSYAPRFMFATTRTQAPLPTPLPPDIPLRLQCVVPAEPPRFHGRRPGLLRFDMRTAIRLGRQDLLAQLALQSVRQAFRAVEEAANQYLIDYATRLVPRQARTHATAAVDHAVLHYVVPRGSLAKYLRRVAVALAREGEPPADVAEEASRLGISLRTVYAWRAQQLSESERRARAAQLAGRRARSQAAQALADRLGISFQAARMRLRRALQSQAARMRLRRDVARPEWPRGLDRRSPSRGRSRKGVVPFRANPIPSMGPRALPGD
jgi:hypothetical protein